MNDIKKLMADFLKQQEYSARRSKDGMTPEIRTRYSI